MKKCPTCQRTFDDDKRFCQIDGTLLIAAEPSAPSDPYQTIVGGPGFIDPPTSRPGDAMKTTVVDADSNDEDILQLPEVFDPMKTMVVGEPIKKENLPVPPPPPKESPKEPLSAPEPPKFNEPSLNPPSFGDLSSASGREKPKTSEPPKSSEAPKIESPFPPSPILPSEPPKPGAPQGNTPSFGSPFANDPPKFGSPFGSEKESGGASSDKPKNNSFPPFKDSTTPLGEKKDPFQNSSFALPQTPLEQSYASPKQQQTFSPPPAAPQDNWATSPAAQNDWNPPPAPVAGWQNQDISADTPFQPPVVAASGQNQTLAIVSLVCGILSLCLCGFITGIPAIITGYLAKNNADQNPAEYGGRGMALAGMILGGISIVFTVLYVIYIIAVGATAGFR